jgi:hypothetical protein
LDGLYQALFKPAGGVEDILGTYFAKSPPPTLSLADFSYPPLSLLVRYVRQALRRRERGSNVLLYGLPGNRLLETNPVPAIWICNQLDGIDQAHVRRFDLVIEVPLPPLQAREKMLVTRLGGLKVGGGFLRELAQNVHLAPSHIDKAVKGLHTVEPGRPKTPAKSSQPLLTIPIRP